MVAGPAPRAPPPFTTPESAPARRIAAMTKAICPVCNAPVPADELEAHASACLDATESAHPPPTAALAPSDGARLLPPAEGPKPWSSGLFDCHTHAQSCLLSWCCPAVQFSLTQGRAFPEERLGCGGWFCVLLLVKLCVFAPFFTHPEAMARYYEREDPMAFDVIRARLAFYSAVAFVAIFAYRRGALRSRFGIGGSWLSDACAMLWCTCCALAQEWRQVEHEEARAAATAVVEATIAREPCDAVEAIPVAKEV